MSDLIGQLTDEMKAKIPYYKSKCVDDLFSGKEHAEWKRENTVEYVRKIYELSKQEIIPIVIVANTINEYKKFFNLLFNNELNKENLDKLRPLHEQLNGGSPCNFTDVDFEEYLRNYNLTQSDYEKRINADYHYVFILSEYARVYLTWYYFINVEYGLELPDKKEEIHWLYNRVFGANISKVYLTDKICLVLRMPKTISKNDRGFHDLEKGAIVYDDMSLYFINNVQINEDVFMKLKNQTYTFEDFTNERNEEVKSAALAYFQEKYGEEYVFRFLSKNMKEIDTYVDKKDETYLEGTTKGMNVGVYTLFKGTVNDVEIAYVRCFCPSTDRMFFLGCEAVHKNAKDAIASLYRVPRKLVDHITYIQRQGEVFATNFSEEGMRILESMTPEEIADQVPVNGDTYFKLMRYEY